MRSRGGLCQSEIGTFNEMQESRQAAPTGIQDRVMVIAPLDGMVHSEVVDHVPVMVSSSSTAVTVQSQYLADTKVNATVGNPIPEPIVPCTEPPSVSSTTPPPDRVAVKLPVTVSSSAEVSDKVAVTLAVTLASGSAGLSSAYCVEKRNVPDQVPSTESDGPNRPPLPHEIERSVRKKPNVKPAGVHRLLSFLIGPNFTSCFRSRGLTVPLDFRIDAVRRWVSLQEQSSILTSISIPSFCSSLFHLE